MRPHRPAVLFLAAGTVCAAVGAAVGATACATAKPGGPETTVAPATTSLVVGSSAMGTMNIGTTNTYTAIATPVAVSPDSAFQVLSRVYAMLQIPMAPVAVKRAVGNDEIKIRRRIAGHADAERPRLRRQDGAAERRDVGHPHEPAELRGGHPGRRRAGAHADPGAGEPDRTSRTAT